MRKSNGFALIIFFFIVAIVAGAIYLLVKGKLNSILPFAPTEATPIAYNSTANWETYSGSDFEFKCPTEWKIERSVGSNEVACDNGNLNKPVFVGVQVLNKIQAAIVVPIVDISTTVVDSTQAKIYDEEVFDGSKTINTSFTNYRVTDIGKGSLLYRVYLAATSKEDIVNNLQLFNQILSTFKFVGQTQTCIPRPACLDSIPRCMIAEPINGWCK